MKKIKVALTDDHSLIRDGLRRILTEQENMEIYGIYTCGAELLAGLDKKLPDVLLMDIGLPDYSGNQLLRIISKKYPSVAILALTSMDSLYHINDMMRHGCRGYLTKMADTSLLLEAIETLHAGEQYMESGIKEQWIASLTRSKKETARLTPLTQREKEILQMIVDGKTNKEIADMAFISPRTVESHRLSLMQKLDAKNSLSLVKTAIQQGLIE